ncbi:hypothetical protein Ahy_A01g004067 [Arachis hypogaea]|uniref:Transposase MuDR plant domain-containing protein n=1 Tax=Arachis hypogaea TaxID=3818 RepID=A0A445EUS5_ARAHY|nr:hypothetical protein Ahy_A01g004067 [Arachis hypogaea]
MNDRVLLKVYYFGQILLQTSEGVKFTCKNPLNVVISFTVSFEELKCVICEKIYSEISRKISCILYRYPILVFGGFVQFQTKYITDEVSMQEIFSMYIESRAQILFIMFEEEFESNYEVVGPDGDEDQTDGTMALNVTDVANALANEVLSRKVVTMAMKDYTIRRCVDYQVYESESLTLYAKFTQYGSECDWIIRVSMINRKYCCVIMRYNGSHTCTRATISQNHLKLDSNTIAKAITVRLNPKQILL